MHKTTWILLGSGTALVARQTLKRQKSGLIMNTPSSDGAWLPAQTPSGHCWTLQPSRSCRAGKKTFSDSQTMFNTNMVRWVTWKKKNLRSSVSSSLASPQPPFVHMFFAPIHPLPSPIPFPLASCSWLTLPQPQRSSSWSWTPLFLLWRSLSMPCLE